jgi:hypothetical protein
MRILTHLAMTMADTHVELMLLYQDLCCGIRICAVVVVVVVVFVVLMLCIIQMSLLHNYMSCTRVVKIRRWNNKV